MIFIFIVMIYLLYYCLLDKDKFAKSWAMKKDKIIIMITHRLSTLDFCDKVILLEEGAIKDIGKIDYIKNKYEYILNKN